MNTQSVFNYVKFRKFTPHPERRERQYIWKKEEASTFLIPLKNCGRNAPLKTNGTFKWNYFHAKMVGIHSEPYPSRRKGEYERKSGRSSLSNFFTKSWRHPLLRSSTVLERGPFSSSYKTFSSTSPPRVALTNQRLL